MRKQGISVGRQVRYLNNSSADLGGLLFDVRRYRGNIAALI